MKASLRYVSTSPQKARLVTELVKGRPVEEARTTLLHCKRAAAKDVHKVVMSALANALNNVPEGKEPPDADHLYIDKIWVDKAPSLKRIKPRAMGRAFRILKRHCHINVQLAERTPKS